MGQNFQQSQKTYQPGTNLAAPHLLHEETLLQQFTDRAYELREVKDSLRLQDVAHLAADLEENADFRALPHEARSGIVSAVGRSFFYGGEAHALVPASSPLFLPALERLSELPGGIAFVASELAAVVRDPDEAVISIPASLFPEVAKRIPHAVPASIENLLCDDQIALQPKSLRILGTLAKSLPDDSTSLSFEHRYQTAWGLSTLLGASLENTSSGKDQLSELARELSGKLNSAFPSALHRSLIEHPSASLIHFVGEYVAHSSPPLGAEKLARLAEGVVSAIEKGVFVEDPELLPSTVFPRPWRDKKGVRNSDPNGLVTFREELAKAAEASLLQQYPKRSGFLRAAQGLLLDKMFSPHESPEQMSPVTKSLLLELSAPPISGDGQRTFVPVDCRATIALCERILRSGLDSKSDQGEEALHTWASMILSEAPEGTYSSEPLHHQSRMHVAGFQRLKREVPVLSEFPFESLRNTEAAAGWLLHLDERFRNSDTPDSTLEAVK